VAKKCEIDTAATAAATPTAIATSENANFQSKQTKAKSNQSDPSRAGKSGNQFVKSNN